jgi:hypothetical protein
MDLELFHILPTDKTPEVILDPDGKIKIRGRGLVVNKTDVSDDIIDWIDIYLGNPAEITYVTIAYEYLNSFSTTILVNLLKKLSQVDQQSKKLVIQWYYEVDDEDILERGEYVLSAINIPIEFILTDDITEL